MTWVARLKGRYHPPASRTRADRPANSRSFGRFERRIIDRSVKPPVARPTIRISPSTGIVKLHSRSRHRRFGYVGHDPSRPPNFCESWRRRLSLKGDGEQRVEMTAVADDDPFREARIVSLLADPVDIDAGREQVCASVAHDAHDQKRRLGRNAVGPGLAEHRQTNNMAVALALVNVGSPQRRDPIAQHRTRVRI